MAKISEPMTHRTTPQEGCTMSDGPTLSVAEIPPRRRVRAGGTHPSSRTARGLVALTRRRQPSPTAVLLVASSGAFLTFLDTTVVPVAFPDIRRSFPAADIGSLSWIFNGYNIVFAVFLVVAGSLADVLGRRRTFAFGVALFTVASGLCAAAGSVEALVGFRVLQGVGAAMLVPASLALVIEGFGTARRAHAVSLWGAAAAIAAGLGPPIGGLLVAWGGWRWVFLVNVPLGIAMMLVASRVLIESRAPGRRRLPDLRGATLLAMALGLLALGLVKGGEWGWASAGVTGSLAAGVLALVGFVVGSRSHPVPLIDPALLRIRSFVVANLLSAVAVAGSYSYFLAHVLYLNYVWGYSQLKAGLAVAPAALVAAVVAGVLGRVADRHGHRIIVMVGALIWAAGLGWYLLRVGPEPDFLHVWLPGQLLQGIGLGAVSPLLGSAALARLPEGANYATASAVNGAARLFGSATGVAVLVILIGKTEHGASAEALRRGWVMAACCFIAISIGAVFLGRTRNEPVVVEPAPVLSPSFEPSGPGRAVAPFEPAPAVTDDADLLGRLPLFAGLDTATVAELAHHAEEIELQAGSYLFHAGDVSDSLYVVRRGRLQVLQQDIVLRELGRGDVVGELGLLVDAPRSASIRALRDSKLVRLTKTQFDRIAERGALTALVRTLAIRLHQAPPPAVPPPPSPEVVVAVIGVGADAPVQAVASALVTALSTRLRVVDPGRVDRDGLDRAEQAADKVVLCASINDEGWLDFCLRVADRIVLVAGDPAPPSAPLPPRAVGADLVLAGPSASREHRRLWEELITPRSVHAVDHRRLAGDLGPMAARIAGRSVGLVLGGGGARGLAHIGVLEELERAGVTVDRFAGTSMGAIIAASAAGGLNAAAMDAQIYECFVRRNPLGDYTVPIKGLIRGRRTEALLREAYGERLVEELPKQFRCVSVGLVSRRAVVHRRGLLADAVGCSLRVPGLYPPQVYNGELHVDGAVLESIPAAALAGAEGPLIAVHVGFEPYSPTRPDGRPNVPGIGDTLMRTMAIGSQMAVESALAQVQVVIRPDIRAIGFLEFHQIDAAREAGRVAARQALPQIAALL